LTLALAAVAAHIGVLGPILILGFLIGVYGHISRSHTLVLCGIVLIGAVSLYFVIAGEAVTF